jgi:ABC-type sugar transport system substrate-binding protein
MKKALSILLVVALLAAFAGCAAPAAQKSDEPSASQTASASETPSASQTASASEEPAAKKYQFGLSVPSLEFTFFAAMKTAVEKKFPTGGNIEVTVYNGENNQEKQKSAQFQ